MIIWKYMKHYRKTMVNSTIYPLANGHRPWKWPIFIVETHLPTPISGVELLLEGISEFFFLVVQQSPLRSLQALKRCTLDEELATSGANLRVFVEGRVVCWDVWGVKLDRILAHLGHVLSYPEHLSCCDVSIFVICGSDRMVKSIRSCFHGQSLSIW